MTEQGIQGIFRPIGAAFAYMPMRQERMELKIHVIHGYPVNPSRRRINKNMD
jgi:hypothetical protein